MPCLSSAAPSAPDGGTATLVRPQRSTVKPPPMYQVVLLNDDFTPMDFVVQVLQEFFAKNREAATRIMMQVHVQGRGICGLYPRDIAQTKVGQVIEAAQSAGHPLQCISEPVQ